MLGPKSRAFLQAQTKRLIELDEKEGPAANIAPYVDETSGEQMTGMAKIYDNTLRWMNGPAAARVLGNEIGLVEQSIKEDTLATGVASFITTALPLIRRVYQRLWSRDIMSLQSLNGSSGYMFWFRREYNSTYGDATAGQELADVPEEYRYSASAEQAALKQINLKLTKKEISCSNYKLAGLFTLEAEQDLRAAMGLDASAELGSALTTEITKNIDRVAVNALWAAAKTNVNFNLGGYLVGDTSSADRAAYDAKLWKQAVVQANNAILKGTYRNAGWMLMGPDEFTKFMALSDFRIDGPALNQQAAGGINFVGTYSGWLKIYLDAAAPANKILMGLSPNGWQDAVGVIASYIPLFLSDDYVASNDFSQKMRGAMSRIFVGAIPETSTQSPVQNPGLATITLSSS